MTLLKAIVIGALLGIGGYLFRIYMKGVMCHISERIDGKNVLITGASSGLGLETAVKLASQGGIIHLTCRDFERCQSAREEVLRRTTVNSDRIITYTLDLSSLRSILTFTDSLRQKLTKLDILINNAGVFWCPYRETEDGFEMQMGVNHLGHFLLTNELLDLIRSGNLPRIIIISSNVHEMFSIDTMDGLNLRGDKYGPFVAYGQSKLANVLHARALSRRLKDSGVAVVSLHPGVVHTAIQRELPQWIQTIYRWLSYILLKNTEEGAQTHICCALDSNLIQYTGEYFNDCYPTTSRNSQVYNESLSEWLWQKSEELINSKLLRLR